MMTLRKFRILIGSLILASNFLCIALMVYYGLKFDEGDLEVTLSRTLVVLPIAGLYGLTYYNYITANPNEIASEIGVTLGKASVLTQICVIILFCAALLGFPLYHFTVGAIDQASTYVGATETIFGAYVARTFGLLFPTEILALKHAS